MNLQLIWLFAAGVSAGICSGIFGIKGRLQKGFGKAKDALKKGVDAVVRS